MPTPREIADGLSGEERKKFILSLQTPATRDAMLAGESRSDVEQALYVKQKKDSLVSIKAQCVKEDGSVDLNVRVFTEEEKKKYDPETGTSEIYGRNRKRGAWFEEVRTNYLMKMVKEGKVDKRLEHMIETPHVFPTLEIKEKAKEAFMRPGFAQRVKEKFKSIMDGIFSVSVADIAIENVKKERRKRWAEEDGK